MLKLKEEKKKMEDERIQEEEPANYTVAMADPEKLVAKETGCRGCRSWGCSPSAVCWQP
jgi:hypothetical protein